MKKPISIFSLPSHASEERVSGVDFARIIQPMKQLNLNPEFKVTVWDIATDSAKMEWPQIAKNYDIIYFNYLNHPWGFAAMGAMARHFGCKLVMDIDDALFLIKPDNLAYELFKKGSEGIKTITAIINEVDHLTVTNGYLKNIMANYTLKTHDKITAIDNFIDLDLYTHRSPFRDSNQIKILHAGSTTHFQDLVNPGFIKAIDRLMGEYPNLVIKTVGSFFPDFKMKYGQRYEQGFGDVDIYKWIKDKYPAAMDEADIVIAPLLEDTYNKGKSGIKFLEYSAAKKPGVYQKLHIYEQYIKHGVNGYLASYEDDWYNSLKSLINDAKHRKEVGEAAFNTLKDFTIQKNVYKYATLFKKILLDK